MSIKFLHSHSKRRFESQETSSNFYTKSKVSRSNWSTVLALKPVSYQDLAMTPTPNKQLRSNIQVNRAKFRDKLARRSISLSTRINILEKSPSRGVIKRDVLSIIEQWTAAARRSPSPKKEAARSLNAKRCVPLMNRGTSSLRSLSI